MREMTNEQRAALGWKAVAHYSMAGKYRNGHPAELLGDLLGDLRHWAAKVGVNFEICDKNARACFENEVREEADNAG